MGQVCFEAMQESSQNVLQSYLDLICPIIDQEITKRLI